MPLYEFKCPLCGESFDEFLGMNDKHEAVCKCGAQANRVWKIGALITDTSFCMTGVRDSRLDNEVIEGRSHWNRKLKEKGYMETEYEK
jgi:putative FmdB family regulatory protein